MSVTDAGLCPLRSLLHDVTGARGTYEDLLVCLEAPLPSLCWSMDGMDHHNSAESLHMGLPSGASPAAAQSEW